MKVRLALNGLLLGVLLVSHAEAGVVEISVYGNGSRSVAFRNSSNDSVRIGRAEGSGNIFDGMLTKPVYLGSSRSRDSYSTKHIVYSGNRPTGGSSEPLKEAVAPSRSSLVEANGRAIPKILHDKHENRKDYNHEQLNATSLDTKANQPSTPLPSQAPTTVTVTDHDQNIERHEASSSTTNLASIASKPLEYGTGRVKAYSYFYLSRTLWYVPLYFTLYFCFYILILVIRSIARHKVTYPNNFTGRSKAVQDMQFITNEQAVQKADMLTTFVMKQIEDFKEKYIG